MKKICLRYGGLVLFYLVIIGGVFLINCRFSKVNNETYNEIAYLENK